MKCYQSLIPLFLSCYASFALGAEIHTMQTPYESVAGLGMGGLFVSGACDEASVFFNPANIGCGESHKDLLRGLSFPNLQAGGNIFLEGLDQIISTTDLNEKQVVEDFLRFTRKHPIIWNKFSSFPYVILGRWQFGLISGTDFTSVRSVYSQPQPSEYNSALFYTEKLRIHWVSQLGAITGVSFPWKDTGAFIGLNLRYLYRLSLLDDFEVSDNVIGYSAQNFFPRFQKSYGLGFDLGLGWENPRSSFRPAFGAVLYNVGDTRFFSVQSRSVQEVEPMDLGLGFNFSVINSKIFRSIVAFEVKNSLSEQVLLKDKFGAGIEFRYLEKFVFLPTSIRLGYNFRGLSLGTSLDLWLFRLDYATYIKPLYLNAQIYSTRVHLFRMSVDLR